MTPWTASDPGPATIPAMLDEAVRHHPDRVFLRCASGDLTYSEFDARVRDTTQRLAGAGVAPAETVGLLMRNGADQVATWFALSTTGRLHVPINTQLAGDLLTHVVSAAAITTLVIDTEFLPPVLAVLARLPAVRRILVRGESATTDQLPAQCQNWNSLEPGSIATQPAREIDDLATATLLFTSGSTGRPKACALSHRYMAAQGQLHAKYLNLDADDVLYTPFPLFHIDGANLTVVAALAAGCTAALGERFSVSKFWSEVREVGATVFNFMGATLTMLFRQPPTRQDREHRVRLAWGVPMPPWYERWEPRFGFPLVEVYGSTDAGIPVYDRLDEPHMAGSCGRVIEEYEVITVDENGRRTDPVSVGEILVRGRTVGLVMTGYYRQPEATRRALDPDGWVRTGDRGRVTSDGHLYFHSRLTDSIRRRGENISATDVERLVETHPQVADCAAIGVPSDLTEEDVKIFVRPHSGAVLDADDLIRFCRETMAGFMIPRYVEIVDDLPRTSTEKIDKQALRARGPSVSTSHGAPRARCSHIKEIP